MHMTNPDGSQLTDEQWVSFLNCYFNPAAGCDCSNVFPVFVVRGGDCFTTYNQTGFIFFSLPFAEAKATLVTYLTDSVNNLTSEQAETMAEEILATENVDESAALVYSVAVQKAIQAGVDSATLAAIEAGGSRGGGMIMLPADLTDEVEELQERASSLESKTNSLVGEVQYTQDRLRTVASSIEPIAERAANVAVKPLEESIESALDRVEGVRRDAIQADRDVNRRVDGLTVAVPMIAKNIAADAIAPVEVRVDQVETELSELDEQVAANRRESFEYINDHADRINEITGYRTPEQKKQDWEAFVEQKIQLRMRVSKETREQATKHFDDLFAFVDARMEETRQRLAEREQQNEIQ